MNPKQHQANVRVPMHLCPPVVQVRLAALFRKVNQLPGRYAFNWRDNPTSLATYVDAMERHIAKLKDGEFIDMDTGESHVTMIMGNCAIIEDARLHDRLQHDMDYREPAGKITKLLAEYSTQYKAELPEGVVKFEDGKDCGDPDCKAAECLLTRQERLNSLGECKHNFVNGGDFYVCTECKGDFDDLGQPITTRKPVGYGVFLAKYTDDRSEDLPDTYATEKEAEQAVDCHVHSEMYVVLPVFEDDEVPRERPHDIVSLDDEESEC